MYKRQASTSVNTTPGRPAASGVTAFTASAIRPLTEAALTWHNTGSTITTHGLPTPQLCNCCAKPTPSLCIHCELPCCFPCRPTCRCIEELDQFTNMPPPTPSNTIAMTSCQVAPVQKVEWVPNKETQWRCPLCHRSLQFDTPRLLAFKRARHLHYYHADEATATHYADGRPRLRASGTFKRKADGTWAKPAEANKILAERKRLQKQAARPQCNSYKQTLQLQRMDQVLREAGCLYGPDFLPPKPRRERRQEHTLKSFAVPKRALTQHGHRQPTP